MVREFMKGILGILIVGLGCVPLVASEDAAVEALRSVVEIEDVMLDEARSRFESLDRRRTDIDGEIRQRLDTCDMRLSFEGETALSILGVFPFLDATLSIVDAGENTVAGTVSYQGTNIAVVEVTYNGVGPFQFLFDTKADTITPVS